MVGLLDISQPEFFAVPDIIRYNTLHVGIGSVGA